MATRTEGTVRIEAAPAEILEVISDYESYPDWTDVRSAKVAKSDAKGRPTQVAFEVAMMGFTATYTLAYTYAAKAAGVSWTTKEAGGAVKDIVGEYVLEADGDETEVTYRLAVELAMPVPGLMKRKGEKRVVKSALQGLKRRVEGG